MSAAAQRPGSPPPPPGTVGASTDISHDKRPARIVLVEDEFLIAMSIECDLHDGGYDVVGTAHSADDAVKIVQARRPDMVVMDIRLVGKRDGIDAAREIFETTGIRCLFATAHGDPATMSRAEAVEPLGWLLKPYGRDNLLAAIARALTLLRPAALPE